MLIISTPQDLAAALRETASLALVELAPGVAPPSLASVRDRLGVDESGLDLCGTTRIGGITYGVLLFASAPSAATAGIAADPKATLLAVAAILAFCHSVGAGLVHGNLHLDAISLVGGTVAVSGFEHCGMHPVLPRPSSGGMSWSPPGNIPSMAKELIESGIRTTQTDVYAFGVLIFRLYAGEYPFARVRSSSRFVSAAPVLLASGRRPSRDAIRHVHFTDDLWALMSECWAQEPSARPTMASVCARLAQMQ